MPVVKKAPIFEKIEALSKDIPAPLSWLIPDPYDPSSYIMPMAGLTKEVGANLISKFGQKSRGLNKQLALKMQEGLQKLLDFVPKRALDSLETLELPELVRRGKRFAGEFIYPPNKIGMHQPKGIGFSPSFSDPRTAEDVFSHELGHAIENVMKIPSTETPGREAVAEFLGSSLRKRAGLPTQTTHYTEEALQIYRNILNQESINPFKKVYQYFKSIKR